MEIVQRDLLLPLVVEAVHVQWCGWDELGCQNPSEVQPTTLADFDTTRRTCRSWESALEETVEGAARRLARWEVPQAEPPL